MAIERTFSIIKPDATARNLTGAINAMIEQAGLRIIAQKRLRISRAEAETFYAVHGQRPFFRDLVEFIFHEQGRVADGAASARGASLYLGAGGCYDCHSTDLRGDSAIGVPNLIDKITLYGDGSRQALFMSIANGRQGVCPAWVGQISPAGIRELALYVYSLSHTVGSKHDN